MCSGAAARRTHASHSHCRQPTTDATRPQSHACRRAVLLINQYRAYCAYCTVLVHPS